ncbi:MAG TPA: stage V sporulation protein T [Candidatus Avoscillospira avistercoris]|uniref:Stage V sporulation protein T n=1 Tax=Candidatus Avoscillospira avistercoris TaxID=2840707 RepID=A0A9D1JSK6_9FIRM|nr:stage V sporulation protein T [Candidatus Avoscillospira avistercoris]
MGDLSDFAGQLCESIYKNTGHLAAISDRDTVIALSGGHRRELGDKRVSNALEQLMEQRKSYRYAPGGQPVPVVDGSDHHTVGVAAPILAEGDVLGSVVLVTQADEPPLSEDDQKLAQTIASFLGRQMES